MLVLPRATILLIALLARPAISSGKTEIEPGSFAPAGAWYTRGGCAAHTGVASTSAIHSTPAVAWRYTAEGTIQSEPLVWGSQIVLEVQRADGARRLEAVALESGKRLAASPWFNAREPLAPGLWGKRIVARTSDDQFSGLRISGAQMASVWTYKATEKVSTPLFFGNEVYYRTQSGVSRTSFGRLKPSWTTQGAFRGEIALRGDAAFAVEYDDVYAHLVALDRSKGVKREVAQIGFHRAGRPEFQAPTQITLLDGGRALVEHAIGVPVQGGGEARCIWIGDPKKPLPLRMEPIAPAATAGGVFGFLEEKKSTPALCAFDGGERVPVLANSDIHPEFAARTVPVTIAGGVGYLGAGAFDVDTWRILFDMPIQARFRAVPVHEGVLLVEGASSLFLLSGERARTTKPIELVDWSSADAQGKIAFKSGTAVWRDGTLRRGSFKLDTKRVAQFPGGDQGPAIQASLDELALIEDGKGSILFAATPDAAVEALQASFDDDLARRFTELAVDAGTSRDPALIDRILGEARSHGSSDPRLDRAQEMLERLERDHLAADPARAKTVEGKEKDLLALSSKGLVDRAAKLAPAALADGRAAKLRITLLSAALQENPVYEPAKAALRALLPPGLADVDPASAPDLLDALGTTAIEVVAPDAAKDGAPDPRATLLASYKKSWREDMCALASSELLILAPRSRVHTAARCLEMGEVVCHALREIFPSDPTVPKKPLLLLLFETREEYLSGAGGGETSPFLKQTAGAYDPEKNLMRIFVPEGREAIQHLLSTYAHELTHHWLGARWDETVGEGRWRTKARAPGFWIVEGLASMVQELEFDVDTCSWKIADDRAESLDVLAHLQNIQRPLTWDQFFARTQVELQKAKPDNLGDVRSRTHLGLKREMNDAGIYYTYAAAACHYLFAAEDGAYRAKLLAYASSWYHGRKSELDVAKVFGLEPDELGGRIEVWARKTSVATPH
jgi:hypothetical protein